MNSMKRQNYKILKEELPTSVSAQYVTGDQWRNNSRKNEGMEPKQKQYPVVDVTGNRSMVRCCKQQYCIGTWNVSERLLLNERQPGFLASRGEEFNLGPEMRFDRSELCVIKFY